VRGGAVTVRVRDAANRETRVPIEIIDESGHVKNPMVMAAGTPVSSIQVNDVNGQPLTVPPAPTMTLVFFYDAWNDPAVEVAWLDGIRREYGPRGLTIVGVGSVPQDDVAAWRERLAELKADWQNVADTDGSVAAAFEIPRRKVIGNGDGAVFMYLVADGKIADGLYAGTDNLTEEEKDDETGQYLPRALERLLPR
jgi:hypothetical protein